MSTEENRKAGFTIKTIEGFGDNKAYYRLADDLVRRSNVFKKLCLKIYHLSSARSRSKKWHMTYKTNYKQLKQEFAKYERDCDRVFKAQEKKIERLERNFKQLSDSTRGIRRRFTILTRLNKKLSEDNMKLNNQIQKTKSLEDIVAKKVSWGDNNSDVIKSEMMLRSMFGFEELKFRKMTDFSEMMYLAIGTQLESFSRKEVDHRFDYEYTRFFNRDMEILIDKGYIRKFEKKSYYYITPEGKGKLLRMMNFIHGRQYGFYWSKIFNK